MTQEISRISCDDAQIKSDSQSEFESAKSDLRVSINGGFHKCGYPKIDGYYNGKGKSLSEMDDLGVPLFKETAT